MCINYCFLKTNTHPKKEESNLDANLFSSYFCLSKSKIFPKKKYISYFLSKFFLVLRVSKNQNANFRHSMWKLLSFHKFRNSKNQQMIHIGHLDKQELLIWTNLMHIMSEYQLMFYENKNIYRMNSSHFFLSIFPLSSSSVSLFLLVSFFLVLNHDWILQMLLQNNGK